eukprot:8562024-Pyramimonas_sp.AAC.1
MSSRVPPVPPPRSRPPLKNTQIVFIVLPPGFSCPPTCPPSSPPPRNVKFSQEPSNFEKRRPPLLLLLILLIISSAIMKIFLLRIHPPCTG